MIDKKTNDLLSSATQVSWQGQEALISLRYIANELEDEVEAMDINDPLSAAVFVRNYKPVGAILQLILDRMSFCQTVIETAIDDFENGQDGDHK